MMGKEKTAANLGHQNDPNVINLYSRDSNDNNVPGTQLCNVMKCGMAMNHAHSYVHNSADKIGFEKRDLLQNDEAGFDGISSHLIKCKY